MKKAIFASLVFLMPLLVGAGNTLPASNLMRCAPLRNTLTITQPSSGAMHLEWQFDIPSTEYGVRVMDMNAGGVVVSSFSTVNTSATVGGLTPGGSYKVTVSSLAGFIIVQDIVVS